MLVLWVVFMVFAMDFINLLRSFLGGYMKVFKRMFRLNLNRSSIWFLPLVVVIMFAWQFWMIKQSVDEEAVRLEKLAKQCRDGSQKACEEYSILLDKQVRKQNK